MEKFTITKIYIGSYEKTIRLPNICPHCSQVMTPDIICKTDHIVNFIRGCHVFSILVKCVHCQEFYALTYETNLDNGNYPTLITYTYSKTVDYDLPREVEEFSPKFKEIYKQAQIAELYNLNHIAGMGYRKSIEFLIKDYLITVKKLDETTISKLTLMQAINNLDNDSIKILATASTWIGNDETHYTRKHEDKNITDIKRYLRTLATYLTGEYNVSTALSFINKK